MSWLVEKRNDRTGIVAYLLGTSPGCTAWGGQRHKAMRFPTKADAEKAAFELDCEQHERIIVREETPSHSRATLT